MSAFDDNEELKKQRKDLEDSTRMLKQSQEVLETGVTQFANLLYYRKEALQAAGFSKEEAFQLVLARGLG